MDPEIKAMSDLAAALERLEPEVAQRVLRWANQRWSLGLRTPEPVDEDGDSKDDSEETSREFDNFHELMDAADPSSGLGRILATAYWFQVVSGQDNFQSFQINKELKNLGHPSGNITRDLSSLMRRSPRLVMQVRKEGTTKQARKQYRLTREGVRAVQQMLAGEGEF